MPIVEDYSLLGPNGPKAVADGLADGEWWQPAVDPKTMRALQRRTNLRALWDTSLWLGLIGASGYWAYVTIWSWWSVPAFAVYGALVGGASDSRWHECGHGTAFRSRTANEVVYYLACFGLLRGPSVWRWSHFRHHTDTIVVGRDYEIAFRRGMGVWRALYAYTGIPSTWALSTQLVRHSTGRIDPDVATFLPEQERRRTVWESRVFVAVLAGAVVAAAVGRSVVPLMFVGLPTLYGAWLVVFFGITQHAGLEENVLDHRYSTRTVYMNPLFRFLYSNMNYHVEHHIFPSVPYHALPRLHTEIADSLAPALPTTTAAYRQVFGALRKQAADPEYQIPLEVPEVPSAVHAKVDVGVENWMRTETGSFDLGAASSIPIGDLRAVTVDGNDLVLGRPSGDTYCLADRYCTHQKVSLAGGAIVDGQIECPKHNARFDCATGQPTRKPARTPLAVYEIEAIGGRLITDLRRRNDDQPSDDEPTDDPSIQTRTEHR